MNAFDIICRAFEAFNKSAERIIKTLNNINSCKNERVIHLAFRSKKKRIRKKNYNKLFSYLGKR